ncbi:DUF952 domain-containing protein [Candidatus Roizmanbacteria bacterium]|nr:DUF952 domain-containing protein [Candidatus Roizmanbacteria bacterium]
MLIYHLIPKTDWDKAKMQEFYSPTSLAKEGFIHASTKEQILPTANRIFKGRNDLLILTIDTEKVTPKIIYEFSSGSGEKHPHIYGPLSLDAVCEVKIFNPGC